MSKPENPFAFPQPYERAGDGMTLRDWFAGRALPACIPLAFENRDDDITLASQITRLSYQIADAMLAERSRS